MEEREKLNLILYLFEDNVEKILDKSETELLRQNNILNNHEIAIRVGDLVIAENIITRERRVLNNTDPVLKESKRLLKG